jgi:hypothetical protein
VVLGTSVAASKPREEQRLHASIRKPADARSAEQIALTKAERDAQISTAEARAKVKLEGQGDPKRIRALGRRGKHHGRRGCDQGAAVSLAETQDAVIGKQKGGAVAREPASLPQEVKEAITRVYGYESTHIARFCPNLSGKLAQQTKP